MLLCLLFHRVRIIVRLFPRLVIDAENRQGMHPWNSLIVVAHVLVYPRLHRHIQKGILLTLILALAWQYHHRTPVCYAWMDTDVGYIQRGDHSLCLQTLCAGQVWEPHVVEAMNRYLYGQGRAIDVGGFVGYHTLRLVKNAAPYTVHVWEGRTKDTLEKNLRRNNAQHAVQMHSEVIQEGWNLTTALQEELIQGGPLSFVKIDCEGCELAFLKGMADVIRLWHPVLVLEIQDDVTRQGATVRGQQMILPIGTRNETLQYIRNELGYSSVEPLLDVQYGTPTWDYLALY